MEVSILKEIIIIFYQLNHHYYLVFFITYEIHEVIVKDPSCEVLVL